jgi:hypothetical protein
MFFTFTAPASDGIKPRSIPWTDGCPLPNLRLISHSRCPLNTFIKIDSLTLPSSSLVIHLPTLRGCSQSPDRDMVAKPHKPDEGREANHRPNISLKKWRRKRTKAIRTSRQTDSHEYGSIRLFTHHSNDFRHSRTSARQERL